MNEREEIIKEFVPISIGFSTPSLLEEAQEELREYKNLVGRLVGSSIRLLEEAKAGIAVDTRIDQVLVKLRRISGE